MNGCPRCVTLWYRWDIKERRYDFNHLEEGWAEGPKPEPKNSSFILQQHWKNHEWRRIRAMMNEGHEAFNRSRRLFAVKRRTEAKPWNNAYELVRVARSTEKELRLYRSQYLKAAKSFKAKYGKKFTYRREWLESAWSIRQLLRRGVVCTHRLLK